MILTKEDIEKYLVFQDNDKQFYLEELPLKKEEKTRAQERTYYRCFNEISKKMWLNIDEVKQNYMNFYEKK